MKDELQAVVERFLPKIKKMAKQLRAQFPSVGVDDLQQAGTLGLLKAMEQYEQYDPSRAQLGTWLHPWIKGEMLMYIRKDASSERYAREARDAVEDAFHKHAIGSGGMLGAAILDIADAYVIRGALQRSAEHRVQMLETLASVDAFYAELSERDREFFRLRFNENLTLQEIGLALGYSRSALCRLEQRLREQLRLHLDRGG